MKLQIAGKGGSCKQTNTTHANDVLWYGSYTQLFHLPLKLCETCREMCPVPICVTCLAVMQVIKMNMRCFVAACQFLCCQRPTLRMRNA